MSENNVTFVKQPSFEVYRANNSKNGAASRFSLSVRDGKAMLFLESAKQVDSDANGNANFGWRRKDKETGAQLNQDKSVTIKLGEADIGEFLAVISGRKDNVGYEGKGIFHQNDKGNSTLQFNAYGKVNEAPNTFMLTVSKKGSEDKTATKISHSVSFGEAEVLRVFLTKALNELNNW